ncbi:CIA30 family protein [Xanthomarina sp. F2636L]|uniref:CIA30 family protein n=1 Tax=Xanthomarina sp. F2636L TaxID=2996018 RepID=UPI00225DE8A0|nr:CIA30 family protein [Xanthomarina sp. F2636L]MCX7549585.1 CIA30 family protein [Xanthomarina sp. F2636L]
MVLYNSKFKTNLSQWQVVNDVVMGGCSHAQFALNKAGFGEFSGHVSLENNGGFSSVKYSFSLLDVDNYDKIHLKFKAEPCRFQFRLKSNITDRHSYVSYFKTSGDWQEIEFDLTEFYPRYRGRNLQLSKYPGKFLEEIGFLIANKKTQDFKLEIAQIWLE